MVRTEYSANVYVNNMKMNSRAFDHLLDSIQKLDNSGRPSLPNETRHRAEGNE